MLLLSFNLCIQMMRYIHSRIVGLVSPFALFLSFFHSHQPTQGSLLMFVCRWRRQTKFMKTKSTHANDGPSSPLFILRRQRDEGGVPSERTSEPLGARHSLAIVVLEYRYPTSRLSTIDVDLTNININSQRGGRDHRIAIWVVLLCVGVSRASHARFMSLSLTPVASSQPPQLFR